MRKGRFSEEQIINVLKEHQAGIPVMELCRKNGISDATFYTWRAEYGGMAVSEARKLKALEDENRKLKKLLAEAMLDAATLREALGKNFPDFPLSSAIKVWYKTGTQGCFCGFERWHATRCNFKRGSARPGLLFFTERRISAGRR